jgi:16S rRNA (guanine(966)-N(2))-methyltransferase RsmD
MKIISGEFRGRNFYTPKTTKVTQSLVRKAVFDFLSQDFKGMSFVDIFAGSGSMGLEALSRGASYAAFIERDPDSARVIKDNLALFPFVPLYKGGPGYEVLTKDAFAGIKRLFEGERRFDIAFIDPPYERDMAKKALKTLEAYDILQPNCMIIVQHDKREILPEVQGRFRVFREKRYGNTYLTIYESST